MEKVYSFFQDTSFFFGNEYGNAYLQMPDAFLSPADCILLERWIAFIDSPPDTEMTLRTTTLLNQMKVIRPSIKFESEEQLFHIIILNTDMVPTVEQKHLLWQAWNNTSFPSTASKKEHLMREYVQCVQPYGLAALDPFMLRVTSWMYSGNARRPRFRLELARALHGMAYGSLCGFFNYMGPVAVKALSALSYNRIGVHGIYAFVAFARALVRQLILKADAKEYCIWAVTFYFNGVFSITTEKRKRLTRFEPYAYGVGGVSYRKRCEFYISGSAKDCTRTQNRVSQIKQSTLTISRIISAAIDLAAVFPTTYGVIEALPEEPVQVDPENEVVIAGGVSALVRHFMQRLDAQLYVGFQNLKDRVRTALERIIGYIWYMSIDRTGVLLRGEWANATRIAGAIDKGVIYMRKNRQLPL